MNKIFVVTTAVALMSLTTLAMADTKSIFEGNAACASTYSQCVKDGVRFAMASTPSDGMSVFQTNMNAMKACDDAARVCYQAVIEPRTFIAD